MLPMLDMRCWNIRNDFMYGDIEPCMFSVYAFMWYRNVRNNGVYSDVEPCVYTI